MIVLQHIPLLSRFEQVILGRGFVADVRFLSRTTGVREFRSTWIYGVNPGGLAEAGETILSAGANFRNALTGIFFDLVEEADGFEAYCATARSFVEATDGASVCEWVVARQAIRDGRDPALDGGVDLRSETGDRDREFVVSAAQPADAVPELHHFVPRQQHWLAA